MRREFGSNRNMAGFGLVEILIALVLGMILTVGMTNVFLSSKQAYRTQSALSVIQENGRYAVEVLSRGIRMAGFSGCPSLDIIEPNVISKDVSNLGGYSADAAIRGYHFKVEGGSGKFQSTKAGPTVHVDTDEYGNAGSTADDPVGVIDGTDVITVSSAGDCGAYLTGNMAADNANVQVDFPNNCDFKQYDTVMITDCNDADIFTISNNPVGGGAIKITLSHAKGVNNSNRLQKPYSSDAMVFKFSQHDYYIKNNAFGEPALFRRDFVKGAYVERELVEGVENMQIVYGEDTNGDFMADDYVQETDVDEWGKVNSVRLELSLVSKLENVTIDRDRMRQDMATTIGVRNKLP